MKGIIGALKSSIQLRIKFKTFFDLGATAQVRCKKDRKYSALMEIVGILAELQVCAASLSKEFLDMEDVSTSDIESAGPESALKVLRFHEIPQAFTDRVLEDKEVIPDALNLMYLGWG